MKKERIPNFRPVVSKTLITKWQIANWQIVDELFECV